MVCYASPEKCQPLPLQKTSGTRTREGEVLSTPPLQPSSRLFQIAVLVCPDAGVQIELSKVVTHRQRQWGFLAERALSYSCFRESVLPLKEVFHHYMMIAFFSYRFYFLVIVNLRSNPLDLFGHNPISSEMIFPSIVSEYGSQFTIASFIFFDSD